MGGGQAKLQRRFIDAILKESESEVNYYLKEHPALAKESLYNGKTNPICRAASLGH
jgi:hypothetical protein